MILRTFSTDAPRQKHCAAKQFDHPEETYWLIDKHGNQVNALNVLLRSVSHQSSAGRKGAVLIPLQPFTFRSRPS